MNENNDQDLILAVEIATILFFLMVAFIVSYFIIYRRRKQQHVFEMRVAKEEYEKQLLQSQLEIQEQTFNQISQEIHDNVGQLLSLARIQINIMNESENFDRQMLDEIKENVGKAMMDLRDIARSLNSDRIRNTTLIEAVAIECERINKSGVLRMCLEVEGAECAIGEQRRFILFRVIQECVQNILKHAGAKEVQVRLCYLPQELKVIVQDDGKGFDVAEVAVGKGGMGLVNIRTRVGMTGGDFAIDSVKGKGTLIQIKIPYG
ncbi:MAG TPA: ATP-binding protein [Puia sp.]|nr:ATP-binding protein [Puia sp.]